MKYFSIDLETSGLDPNNNQILEFAAIYEDTETQLGWEEIPKFERIITHKQITGSPGALHLNARLFKILAKLEDVKRNDKKKYMEQYNIIAPNQLKKDFYQFALTNLEKHNYSGKSVLNKNDSITINAAGKNFGTFDLRFIEQLDGFKNHVRFSQRILDPAILYFNNSDNRLPNLTTCKVRAGIKAAVTHKAIDDAWDVIEILRNKLPQN